jgi:hypothetical protein
VLFHSIEYTASMSLTLAISDLPNAILSSDL